MKHPPQRTFSVVARFLVALLLLSMVSPIACKAPEEAGQTEGGAGITPGQAQEEVKETVKKEENKVEAGAETQKKAAENIEEKKEEVKEEEKEKPIQTLKIGNYALPSAQTPGPCFSFGQNIIDKHDFQIQVFPQEYRATCSKYNSLTAWFLYEMTDKISVLLSIPAALDFTVDGSRSAGIADLSVEFEFLIHDKVTLTGQNYATIVTAIGLPAGSATKNPPTGFGSPSFFLGATAAHLGIDWYVFTSQGIILTTNRKGTRFGNRFFYEGGIGHNLCHLKGFIVHALLELNGEFYTHDIVDGAFVPDSGGNTLFMGPSFWFSSERFLMQAGVQFPISEKLFGVQDESEWRNIFVAAWTYRF